MWGKDRLGKCVHFSLVFLKPFVPLIYTSFDLDVFFLYIFVRLYPLVGFWYYLSIHFYTLFNNFLKGGCPRL